VKVPAWPWLAALAPLLEALRFPRRESELGVTFEQRGMALEEVLPAMKAIDEVLGWAEASRKAWDLPKTKASGQPRSRFN
jgi:hypothetical protein